MFDFIQVVSSLHECYSPPVDLSRLELWYQILRD